MERPTAPDEQIERAARLARITDLGMLDPLIGFLLPGAGDALGALIGLYIVGVAWRKQASPVLIARMLLNLAVDAGLGLIPFVGDLADLANRANVRNVELLRRRVAAGTVRTRPWDWLVLLAAVLLLVAVLVLPVILLVGTWQRLTS